IGRNSEGPRARARAALCIDTRPSDRRGEYEERGLRNARNGAVSGVPPTQLWGRGATRRPPRHHSRPTPESPACHPRPILRHCPPGLTSPPPSSSDSSRHLDPLLTVNVRRASLYAGFGVVLPVSLLGRRRASSRFPWPCDPGATCGSSADAVVEGVNPQPPVVAGVSGAIACGRRRRATRARHRLDFAGAQDGRALGDEGGDDLLLVGLAAQQEWRLLAHVGVAPLPERGEGDAQVAAFVGEPVLVALGPLAVADTLEDSLLDEPVQPVGEDVAGDAKALLQLVEAA